VSDREELLGVFLKRTGWGRAVLRSVSVDASSRRYIRLDMGKHKAILMDAPTRGETDGADRDAKVDDRRSSGYSAMARLAGPNIKAFVCIAHQLFIRGFSVPDIYDVDFQNGFVLLEDYGINLFARAIELDAKTEKLLYEAAVDTLAAIYRSSFFPDFSHQKTVWRVMDYDETALLAEMDLCLDWYAPDVERNISAAARDIFSDLWRGAFQHLSAHAPGLCLRDFHAENLFWLPERQATSRVGLIDFQDALFVHPAYDLTSLLEDIRRDVDIAEFEPLKQRFCEKAGLAYDENFRTAYAVLSTQRATKLLGFTVRADRAFGKPQYRALLPRAKRHLQRHLSHPVLRDIQSWYALHIPEVLR